MVNRKPLVSIGMPAYNGDRYLRQALDSLLAQDYENFELIVSDDASTDRTQAICQEYLEKDRRVRYYRNSENQGTVQNFNRVFELAIGEYFMWAPQDGLWDKTYLQKCIAKLQEHPAAVMCCSEVTLIDETGNLNPTWTPYRTRDTLGMGPGDRVYELLRQLAWMEIYSPIRRDALKQTRLITPRYGTEVLLGLELSLLGEIAKVPEPLFKYRVSSTVVKTSYDLMLSLSPADADRQAKYDYLALTQDLFAAILTYQADAILKNQVISTFIHTVINNQEWIENIAKEQSLPYQERNCLQQIQQQLKNHLKQQYLQINHYLMSSRLCIYRDFKADFYKHWITQLKEPFEIHRKEWEYVAVVQSLYERGFLQEGKKGLGFAVGTEPLPSLFASLGCEIVATDQEISPEALKDWATTNQLCHGKQVLNQRQICPPDRFEESVTFQEVDMNYIPENLRRGEFDFIWSSCAFEHIGSLEKGLQFVKKSLDCLKNGGIAVHTTEFNCSSNEGTLDAHNLVFYRHRDLERLIAELEQEGHWVESVDYTIGDAEQDRQVARPPYQEPHLKLLAAGYVATSVLLVIHKQGRKLVANSQETWLGGLGREKPIKLIYDISVLGYGHHLSRSRTGVARVIENIALGLLESREFDLSFCGSHSLYAVNACLDYLESQPVFKEIPFLHPPFLTTFQSKLVELYRMLEVQAKLYQQIGGQSHQQALLENLKVPLANSLNLVGNYPNLIEAETLSEADIYHATFYHVPDQVKRVDRVKRFVTLYDLIPIVLSHLFVGKNDDDYKRMLVSLQGLTPDDYILCISQATRNDLLNHVKTVDPAKVFVTYLAANPDVFYPCTEIDKVTAVRKKYRIPDAPYILGVSTLEPRKNLEHVIRCFAQVVQQQGIKDLYLVLVGALGWDYERIFSEISKWGLSKDRIIVTGYVADEDLAALYTEALVFVYPSLYEGFGLPPLEAMQCGVPVITSNTSSLPEVVGDAGMMLSPQDGDGLCQSLLRLYNTPSLRREMSLKSLEQAKKFSWARCIQETIDTYKLALSR